MTANATAARAIDKVLEQHATDERVRIAHQCYQAIQDGYANAARLAETFREQWPDTDIIESTANAAGAQIDEVHARTLRLIASMPR